MSRHVAPRDSHFSGLFLLDILGGSRKQVNQKREQERRAQIAKMSRLLEAVSRADEDAKKTGKRRRISD